MDDWGYLIGCVLWLVVIIRIIWKKLNNSVTFFEFIRITYMKKKLTYRKYKVEIGQLSPTVDDVSKFEPYKYKDGYIIVFWSNNKGSGSWGWKGFTTPDELKTMLGEKQYKKFCEGKREFILNV